MNKGQSLALRHSVLSFLPHFIHLTTIKSRSIPPEFPEQPRFALRLMHGLLARFYGECLFLGIRRLVVIRVIRLDAYRPLGQLAYDFWRDDGVVLVTIALVRVRPPAGEASEHHAWLRVGDHGGRVHAREARKFVGRMKRALLAPPR